MRAFQNRALLLLGFLIAAGCSEEGPSGPASQVIVPESWRGMWQITYRAYTCDDDSLIDVSEDVRPACPGQTLEEFLGIAAQDIELECTGDFTDADLTAHCTGWTNLICEITFSADVNATRADSLFTGTAVLHTTLDCGSDRETECETYRLDGVRIDPNPSVCGDSLPAPSLSRPRH